MDTTIVPALDDNRVLRHVEIDHRYRLLLWDTYRCDRYGKSTLGYAFSTAGGEVIFCGEDFGAPMGDVVDSDATLRSLLGFLTLRPGDTDAEYFADYTEAQHAFARSDAEEISMWAMEARDNPPAFVNLDGWDE
jgi:hypothetical protein